jgi:hypothetical protein
MRGGVPALDPSPASIDLFGRLDCSPLPSLPLAGLHPGPLGLLDLVGSERERVPFGRNKTNGRSARAPPPPLFCVLAEAGCWPRDYFTVGKRPITTINNLMRVRRAGRRPMLFKAFVVVGVLVFPSFISTHLFFLVWQKT